MNKLLFIGTFLSKKNGTKGVSESIATELLKVGYNIKIISNKENKFLRFFEIFIYTFFSKYNIVHIDTFSGNSFIICEVAVFISRLRRKKIILTLHGGALPEFYVNNFKRIKTTFDKSNIIQTPSIYLKVFFESKGFNIHFLPNPIKLNTFPYNRKNINKHTILWVRAFTEIYNPKLAINVLYEVKKIYKDVKLTMIGPNKGMLDEIIKYIKDLNLEDSVNILGPVNNNMLYKYYQTHHVYINTTKYESFGVALVEAASCGIPIISTSVGDIPFSWIDNENILLVKNFDIKIFADHCINIFSNDEFSNKLSVNARLKVESFDWSVVRDKWLQILS